MTPTASTSALRITIPNTVTITWFSLMRSGTPSGDGPSQSNPTFCRMKENPTAVMSGASFGALRSGR